MLFDITAERVDCKYPATIESYDMKGKVLAWCLKNSSMKYGIRATGGYKGSEFGGVLLWGLMFESDADGAGLEYDECLFS